MTGAVVAKQVKTAAPAKPAQPLRGIASDALDGRPLGL
jgi:hypothetical protein